MNRLRVALVNDWLIHVRGQERVFQALCDVFPKADIYALVYDRDQMPQIYAERGVRTSFVQHLPGAKGKFRTYLPLYPLAARGIDLRSYDLVIASSSAFVHGVTVGQDTVLVCYCHSPFRYIWSHWETLVVGQLGIFASVLRPVRSLFRKSDVSMATRVNRFIATSRLVQQRIVTVYGRDSIIIPPAVDLHAFCPVSNRRQDYYLIVSPLVRWKRVDIAVRAFVRLGLPLKIVGAGEDEQRLRAVASNNIEFVGWRSHTEVGDLARLYCECRALVVTSEEDFGLAPLEAMACGTPVISLRAGGALDTVVEGVTGAFFDLQVPEALEEAIRATDCDHFDRAAIRDRARRFGLDTFTERIVAEVQRCAARGPTAVD